MSEKMECSCDCDLSEAIRAIIEEELAKHKAGVRGAAAPTRSAAQVGSAFTDLWSQLKAMGAQVDWSIVLQQFFQIVKQLIAGKNVGEIIAWLMTLFGGGLAPTPAGPAVGKGKA